MAQTVYVALGCVDYEGDEVVGVYNTRDAAVARCQGIHENSVDYDEFHYHSYRVSAWEIGHYMSDQSQAWSWRPAEAANH